MGIKLTQTQTSVLQKVVAKYWQQEATQLTDRLDGITIINKTPPKIVGFIPEYKYFPAAFFKIYFAERSYENEVMGYKLANTIHPIGNIRVPKIIELLPEQSAILLEKIPMQDSLIEIRRIFYKKSEINWNHLGNWLRAFHDTEPLSTENRGFIEYSQSRLDQHLKQVGHLFRPNQVEAIKNISLSAKDYVDQNSIDWVNMHGDFNIDSIKLSKSATFIIDFERLTVAPRTYEVINFLAALQFSIYFLYRKSFFHWFLNEFLEGYGIQIESTPLNHFFYLKTIFDLIAHYDKRKSVSKFYAAEPVYNMLKNVMINATGQFLNKPFNSWTS
ncbi:MAG: aminoglycoside phosphotransferase family protein [Anaerolineaceae bacterium]|nr:aminoglycoside phosphotransferase family protein [Anaerolineaceae bacterium]